MRIPSADNKENLKKPPNDTTVGAKKARSSEIKTSKGNQEQRSPGYTRLNLQKRKTWQISEKVITNL